MIDVENINHCFSKIIQTEDWRKLEEVFSYCDEIFFCCHGGNMAIVRHLAADITRLTAGKKVVYTPDVDTVAVWHGDFDYTSWLVNWLRPRIEKRKSLDKILIVGLSSSGASPDVDEVVSWAHSKGCKTTYLSSQPVDNKWGSPEIVTSVSYYYESEVMTMLLAYQLLRSSGTPPPRIKTLIDKKQDMPRLHSFDDELINIGVDFDLVLHKYSKGYHDGTLYDEMTPGAAAALQKLSDRYTVIVYTCKAKKDRGLVNGKTGTELVWEWLEKNDLAQYVSKVTAEKPRAVAYIDDKAIRFSTWDQCLKDMTKLQIL